VTDKNANGKGENEGIENGKAVGKDASKFDWVTGRSACSIPKVYKELRSQVETDVKTRNGLRPENSPYDFSVVERGADFAVLLKAGDVHRSVVFSAAEHAIVVRDDKGDQMFEVTLAFDEEGQCRWNVKGQERDPWQVRRMALDELFFHGY
jgi:hypothetical protein